MMRITILSAIFFYTNTLMANPLRLYINLGDESNAWTWNFERLPFEEYPPFNNAAEIGVYISYLRDLYDIHIAVETGTSAGVTTLYFANHFSEVHTMDNDVDKYQISSRFFRAYSNVHCYWGSSERILGQILPNLKSEAVLFYLDAHGEKYWPLLDELEQIANTHKDNCIIIIDDFKVPGREDIEYDHYDHNECSYEYIKDKLNEVFSDYRYFYLIPRNISSKAKFIAISQKLEMKAKTGASQSRSTRELED